MNISFRARRLAALVTVWILTSGTALAQSDWPQRPVRVILADSPGGSAETVLRSVADKLQKILGQPFVPDFKPGAGTTLAAGLGARATPDGYTFIVTSAAMSGTAPWTFKNPGYVHEKDFVAVARMVYVPNVIIVKNDSPIRSVADLTRQAAANPSKTNVAIAGLGTTQHLSGVLLEQVSKATFTYIPYKSAAETSQSVLAGDTDFGISGPPSVLGPLAGGQLRPIAVTGRVRSPVLPSVPTVEESGIADFDVGGFNGILAPAGTPPQIVQKFSAALSEVFKDPEVAERYRRAGMTPAFAPAPEFAEFLHKELARWQRLVQDARLAGTQ